MKLVCLQENLKNYLNLLERISSKNINLPIISNVLLEANNDNLKISATDLELALAVNINCKVEKPGKLAVPANLLANFINNLPNKKIELEGVGKNLKIICNNFKALINGQDPEEFPIFPKINKEKSEEINFYHFKNGLIKLINIVPLTNIRPEILGVYIKPEGGNFKMAATDSFRLGEFIVNKKLNIKEPFILPLKTAQELIRVFEKDELLSISLDQNQVLFFTEKVNFISRLIDGEYPDYQSIIPKNFKTSFHIIKDDFIKLIKTVSPFVSKGNEIFFKIENDYLEVQSTNSEKGEGSSGLNIKLDGEPLKITLNYKFLLDGLINIDDQELFLGFNNSTSPALLKSKNDFNYIYIIMPIRI